MPDVGPFTMPSPERTARRGVRVARRMGLNKPQACHAVYEAARAAQGVLRHHGVVNVGWLRAVRHEAARLAGGNLPYARQWRDDLASEAADADG